MDQPIDFSGKMKTTNLTVKKQLQRISSMNSLRNGRNEIHSINSENSDECASRSSSSPDSCTGQLSPKFLNTLSSTLNNNINGNLNDTLNNTINTLSAGHNAFSQALMIAAVNQNLAMNLNSQMLINNTNPGLNSLNNFSNLGLMSTANLNPSLTMNSFAKPSNSKKVNSVKRNYDNSKQLNNSQQNIEEPCTTNSLQFLLTEPNSSKIGNKVLKTSATKANKSQQRKIQSTKKQNKKENSFETMLDDSNCEMSLDSNIFQLSVNSNSSQDEHFFTSNSQLDKDLSLDSNGRRRGQPIPSHMKDEIYWLRRRKNNEAAKKSRDAKRAKDLMTAKRALNLENENSNLHNEIKLVKNENILLKTLLKENSLIDDFNKNHIEKLIAQGASMDPEKIRKFSTEFVKNFRI